MIAGGVALTVVGAGGFGVGWGLLITSLVAGGFGLESWKGLLAGGLVSFGVCGAGLGVGIPLIRSGAEKVVRDPLSAHLWIAPGKLTLTF